MSRTFPPFLFTFAQFETQSYWYGCVGEGNDLGNENSSCILNRDSLLTSPACKMNISLMPITQILILLLLNYVERQTDRKRRGERKERKRKEKKKRKRGEGEKRREE